MEGQFWGRGGPPGDICSQHEEGWVWRKERQAGRQEKCLRSRNNGLFSAAPPGLRDRPVGWRPALPCPDHLQHGLLQPSPALGAARGPAWVGKGAPSSPPQLQTHSWIHGSIYFSSNRSQPILVDAGLVQTWSPLCDGRRNGGGKPFPLARGPYLLSVELEYPGH